MTRSSRRQGSRRRYEMLRHLGWRESLQLYAAVIFTFSVLGFFIDLSELDRLTPWPTVLVGVAVTAISSAFFLAAAIHRRIWFAGGMGLLVILISLKHLLPRGLDPVAHPPALAQLVSHARIDGFGCMVGAILGYSLFVRFIARQGTHIVRLDTEIGLAREIHEALAPPIARRFGRFELAGRSTPSSEVGGDLLDAFERDGALVACVADVSGHGVPAGTLMAMVRSAVRVRLDTPASLDVLCADLHRHIAELGRTDRFVTLAAIRFELTGLAEWANAGHPPLLLLRRGDSAVQRLESQSVPLGVPGTHRFAADTIPWRAGDTFVMFTDGLSEVRDAAGNQFGIEAIERILLAQREATPDGLLTAIESAARSHGKTDDDQTVLVVRVGDEEVQT